MSLFETPAVMMGENVFTGRVPMYYNSICIIINIILNLALKDTDFCLGNGIFLFDEC